MLLHNHLDIIGRNEPIQRKAKFWQSYVRALKGTDDIRAPEATHYSPRRGIFRPLLSDMPSWPAVKSIYDDPIHAAERINVPGYRYMPISRETYGISPRNIYPHHYTSLDRYPRHGDHDYVTKHQGEFRHEDHSYFSWDRVHPVSDWDPEAGRTWARPYQPFTKEYSPGPDGKKIPSLYDFKSDPDFQPTRGSYRRPPLTQLIEPNPWIPVTRFTRDPWWYAYPQYRPFQAPYIPGSRSPAYLRDSYLSPVKRTYLWTDHPIRPFTTTPRLNF